MYTTGAPAADAAAISALTASITVSAPGDGERSVGIGEVVLHVDHDQRGLGVVLDSHHDHVTDVAFDVCRHPGSATAS